MCRTIYIIPDRVYNTLMNTIAEFIKQKRKEAGLTQEDFAIHSGLGLRFVRELEQGKETVIHFLRFLLLFDGCCSCLL